MKNIESNCKQRYSNTAKMKFLISWHIVWYMQITPMLVGVMALKGLCTPMTATSSTQDVVW